MSVYCTMICTNQHVLACLGHGWTTRSTSTHSEIRRATLHFLAGFYGRVLRCLHRLDGLATTATAWRGLAHAHAPAHRRWLSTRAHVLATLFRPKCVVHFSTTAVVFVADVTRTSHGPPSKHDPASKKKIKREDTRGVEKSLKHDIGHEMRCEIRDTDDDNPNYLPCSSDSNVDDFA